MQSSSSPLLRFVLPSTLLILLTQGGCLSPTEPEPSSDRSWLDATGDQTLGWAVQDGSNDFDWITGGTVAPQDDIIVVGETGGGLDTSAISEDALESDVFVSRRSARSGAVKWTTQFGSKSWDRATDVVTDEEGFVYVVGSASEALPEEDHAGSSDAFVAKLSPEGVVLWTTQWGTTSGEGLGGVVLDDSGNLVVVGMTMGVIAEGGEDDTGDLFIAKLGSGDGEFIWQHQYPANAYSEPVGIAVDADGNFYVGGADEGTTVSSDSDVFIAKFDREGRAIWRRNIGTTSNDYAFDFAQAEDGRLAIVGQTDGPERSNAFVALVSPEDGSQLAFLSYGGGALDNARSVHFLPGGDVVVGGEFSSNSRGGPDSAYVSRINLEASEFIWTHPLFGAEATIDVMMLTPEGRLIGAGYTYGELFDASSGEADVILFEMQP